MIVLSNWPTGPLIAITSYLGPSSDCIGMSSVDSYHNSMFASDACANRGSADSVSALSQAFYDEYNQGVEEDFDED